MEPLERIPSGFALSNQTLYPQTRWWIGACIAGYARQYRSQSRYQAACCSVSRRWVTVRLARRAVEISDLVATHLEWFSGSGDRTWRVFLQ